MNARLPGRADEPARTVREPARTVKEPARTAKAGAAPADIPSMGLASLLDWRAARRIGRPIAAIVIALVGMGPPAALSESRITVLGPQSAGGRGVTASAGLRIQIDVVRVLTLQAPTGAGSAAWSNGGTVVLGCTGQTGCVSRAAGGSGASAMQMPAAGLTFAQP